jgi:hypothetical protein
MDPAYLQFICSLLNNEDGDIMPKSGSVMLPDTSNIDDFLSGRSFDASASARERVFSWDATFEDLGSESDKGMEMKIKLEMDFDSGLMGGVYKVQDIIGQIGRKRTMSMELKFDMPLPSVKENLDLAPRQPVSIAGPGGPLVPSVSNSSISSSLSNSALEQLKRAKLMPPPPRDVKVGAYTKEERQMRIQKFRAKKIRRVWKKQIKYDCRKKLADTRPRIKGRFVSRKDGDSEEGVGDDLDCGSSGGFEFAPDESSRSSVSDNA